jgi:hypothetical protein
LARRGGLLAFDGALNLSVWFVGGDEKLVLIFESERRKVDQQAVLVGHREMNLFHFRRGLQSGLAHLEERDLHRRAEVFREHLEHGVENLLVRGRIAQGFFSNVQTAFSLVTKMRSLVSGRVVNLSR